MGEESLVGEQSGFLVDVRVGRLVGMELPHLYIDMK